MNGVAQLFFGHEAACQRLNFGLSTVPAPCKAGDSGLSGHGLGK